MALMIYVPLDPKSKTLTRRKRRISTGESHKPDEDFGLSMDIEEVNPQPKETVSHEETVGHEETVRQPEIQEEAEKQPKIQEEIQKQLPIQLQPRGLPLVSEGRDGSLRCSRRRSKNLGHMKHVVQGLKRAADTLVLYDVLDNITTKLSYAVTRLIAEELQALDTKARCVYFQSLFPHKTLLSVTYPGILWDLKVQDVTKYLEECEQADEDPQRAKEEQQVNDEDEGQERKRVKLLEQLQVQEWKRKKKALLLSAERIVSTELQVPVSSLRKTVVSYVLELKGQRHKPVHRYQLHPPVNERKVLDTSMPATREMVSTCLKTPPMQSSATVIQDVQGLRDIVVFSSRLSLLLQHWTFWRLDKITMEAVLQILITRFSGNIALRFQDFLVKNGRLPFPFNRFWRTQIATDDKFDGWLICDDSHYIWLSRRGEWINEKYEVVIHTFDGWSLQEK
ncbi:hypothetical protein SELMODRAFT_421768 [Selaginella moellendorffii]|uniref:Uncharacterized protein n=1 Tax=Selaginella moellendorffii TaxID=88036 RepID=D8SGA8_SELML|nr:hypothetical protein SELMODRAFT_421768 [Selaginella moellendorffii]